MDSMKVEHKSFNNRVGLLWSLLVGVFFVWPVTGIGQTPNASNGRSGDALSERESRTLNQPGPQNMSIDGPAVDRSGRIYSANILSPGSIAVSDSSGVFVEWLKLPDNGRSSSIRISPTNEMFVSDYKNHRVYRIDIETKSLSVYLENQTLNQPNDMAIAGDGSIYLTDPSWKKGKPGSIYRISPRGVLELLATDLKAVNGLDLSPDETKLYFTESIKGELFVLDLSTFRSGEVNPSQAKIEKLHTFEPDTVDGVRTDVRGNVYITRIQRQAVDVVDSTGKVVASIPLKGKFPTNLCFGGHDGKTLFVTTRDQNLVEMISVDSPGREWSQIR
jgi:gluconolactonase